MSNDLALVGTADEIADLAPGDRAVMVTHALVESKAWLAVATKGTDPTPIAEFKAWAATVAEMTRQKGLASEIQADASEMLRRAERGIDLAVRNGQEAGDIKDRNAGGGVPRPGQGFAGSTRRSAEDRDVRPSPKDFFTGGDERSHAYQMGGVTDERFEEVLTEARQEGNLSRINVVRKIKREQAPRSERTQSIAELAATGMSSTQIARQLGVGEQHVRQIARDEGIEIPADRMVGRAHRIDTIRVVRETVNDLAALPMTVDLIDRDALVEIDPSEAQQWTASLTQSIRALNQLNKMIREAVQL